MEELQQAAFEMIAVIGEAKSLFFEAVQHARNNQMENAKECIEKGSKVLNKAHQHHFKFIQKEACGESLSYSILFMHAEDQLLTTAVIKDMCEQFIDVYKDMNLLKQA